MPDYEICYRDSNGAIASKYIVGCSDDLHAKVLAHALMSRDYKQIEVWEGDVLVYERPEKR